MAAAAAGSSNTASNPTADEGDSATMDVDSDTLWSCSRCAFSNQPTNNLCKNCQFNRINALAPAAVGTPPWLQLPAGWRRPPPGVQYLKRTLHPSHPDYIKVLASINEVAQYCWYIKEIVKIYRLENPTLYSMYQLRKIQMDEDNGPGVQNERILFHGTTAKTANIICNRGFNRSYAGKNCTVLGRGVYFANNFGYSTSPMFSPCDHCGIKYIFQCRVLTGLYGPGRPSITGLSTAIEPAVRDKKNYKLYNSVAYGASPSQFVVFEDNNAYPEFLITCRGADCN